MLYIKIKAFEQWYERTLKNIIWNIITGCNRKNTDSVIIIFYNLSSLNL